LPIPFPGFVATGIKNPRVAISVEKTVVSARFSAENVTQGFMYRPVSSDQN
jgi:hypothetical protein